MERYERHEGRVEEKVPTLNLVSVIRELALGVDSQGIPQFQPVRVRVPAKLVNGTYSVQSALQAVCRVLRIHRIVSIAKIDM